jgi:hypothetical protein
VRFKVWRDRLAADLVLAIHLLQPFAQRDLEFLPLTS